MADSRCSSLIAYLLLVALVGGCSTIHAPVEVRAGSGADALAGVWEGTYRSPDTGRSGSVYLALSTRADSAFGEVLMTPRSDPIRVERQQDGTWRWQDVSPGMPEVLTIRFVQVESGVVAGELAPYQDPECGCWLRTTFYGRVQGDSVSGTFVSRSESRVHEANGTWSAQRRS